MAGYIVYWFQYSRTWDKSIVYVDVCRIHRNSLYDSKDICNNYCHFLELCDEAKSY